MKTEPKLTDEQVEFAANFMGWKIDDSQKCPSGKPIWIHDKFPNQSFTNKAITNIAHLSASEKAVMDRAVEEGYKRFKFVKAITHSGWICDVSKGQGGRKYTGKGPTRFIALINALMEARGR